MYSLSPKALNTFFLREERRYTLLEKPIIFQIAIPPEVRQQDVWDFEKQLGQIAGVTTDLRESRDLIAETLLLISIAAPYVTQAVTVAGDINTLHDLAQTISTFLHPKKPDIAQQPWKNKVVIIRKEERIELYNLSSNDIEKVVRARKG